MELVLQLIAQSYETAKRGEWDEILSEWKEIPFLARRCARYQKPSSGWTFLHQAAYFGRECACRELIRLGANAGKLSLDGKSPADIARAKGHGALESLLMRAAHEVESLWESSPDPDILPSSSQWCEAKERRATETMIIAYAGGLVRISREARYFSDSLDRVLVGWHGTYDPPCGMDGESMI